MSSLRPCKPTSWKIDRWVKRTQPYIWFQAASFNHSSGDEGSGKVCLPHSNLNKHSLISPLLSKPFPASSFFMHILRSAWIEAQPESFGGFGVSWYLSQLGMTKVTTNCWSMWKIYIFLKKHSTECITKI